MHLERVVLHTLNMRVKALHGCIKTFFPMWNNYATNSINYLKILDAKV